MRTFLILLLAACTCTGAMAQKKARAPKKATAASNAPKKLTPASVDASTFSYALGVAQGASLKQYLIQREGIDSAYVGVAMQAMQANVSEADAKKAKAYAAGLRIAEMNQRTLPMINKQAVGKEDSTYTKMNDFQRGLCDAVNGTATLQSDSATKVVEQQFAHQKSIYETANAAWLTANAKAKGVKTLKSGMQYLVEKQGNGPIATDSTEVEVNYEGKLIDGTVFDSSYKRGKSATFRPDQVIKGWREALTMMPEGSIWHLYIPADLAYGQRGTQNIPGGSTLIFKVEVVKVKEAKAKN